MVCMFSTLDGVVEDPDGSQGSPGGGWAFRFGPEAVAGDKFRYGDVLEKGTMLLGRRTWQLFSRLWPSRTDPFAQALNGMRKLVASRTLADASAWNNSALVTGELVAAVRDELQTRDVIVTGSLGVVEALRAHDLVDQYRTIVLPVALGAGRRLHEGPADFALVSVDRTGQGVLMIHDRVRAA